MLVNFIFMIVYCILDNNQIRIIFQQMLFCPDSSKIRVCGTNTCIDQCHLTVELSSKPFFYPGPIAIGSHWFGIRPCGNGPAKDTYRQLFPGLRLCQKIVYPGVIRQPVIFRSLISASIPLSTCSTITRMTSTSVYASR